MKLSKLLIFSGLFFIIFGAYLVHMRHSPKKLEFDSIQATKILNSQTTPIRITIPTLSIENSIYESSINSGEWESTTEGVSYLSSSPIPGDMGNSILYGHNWPSLLGNLHKIKPGDKIEILMYDGEKRMFVVKFTSVVNPDQIHILNQTNDHRITLYTCIGFLDSKRFVATAVLSN